MEEYTPKIPLRVGLGLNNGTVYISRKSGEWHSEYGNRADWFEEHWGDRSHCQQLFSGLVDIAYLDRPMTGWSKSI